MRILDPRHLSRIAKLGCIVCQDTIASCHHVRHGQGMGQRSDDKLALPLCYRHHQGEEGIHTLGTRAWERKYGTEFQLLCQVYDLLGGDEYPALELHPRSRCMVIVIKNKAAIERKAHELS